MTRPKRPPTPVDPYYNARIERARPDDPDFGSSNDGGVGERYFRPREMEAREERWALNVPRLRYRWRTVVGPTPKVSHGDVEAARIYLWKLERAREEGEWNSSEITGLWLAIKKWRARAQGTDPRYSLVGNKPGGLDKPTTANVRDARIIAQMRQLLNRRGGNGD